MQLVSDCVVMYDTMKDKKIGIPEVIEKFGVPPEKVIEVQSLIGDSTDNVPGVPGIGVKTAAQLIGEYGDLETLLARAGEIKQEKRRQTLIDNAEKARLSKRLVTLDDKVKLDVPLADLAVHEPDYKLLIAFLKAMEFNTLTRRVAEFSGIEAGEIEAAQPSTRSPRDARGRCRRTGAPSPRPDPRRPACRCPAAAMAPKHAPAGSRRDRAPIEITPQALAAERLEAARKAKFDRSRYEIVQHASTGSKPGSRARATSASSRSTPRPWAKTRCRRRCAASRSRSRRTKPATCRSRIARPATATAAGCSAAGARPTRLPRPTRSAALKPLLEDPGVLKIGQNLKFEWQMFAVRGIEMRVARGHHADVLRARRRPLRPRPRGAGAALLRSHRDRLQRRHRHRKGEGRLRLRRVREGRALCRRGRRPGAAADAGAAAAHGRRAHDQRLRDAGAAAAAGAGAHGAARHLGRPPGAVAAVGRVRAARRRARSRSPRARRRSVVQSRQPEAARRHPVRQDGASRRHQDQDRPVGDRRARARRTRRAGPRAAAEDPGVAADHQAQVDLHRRAAGLHQPDHQARAHQLRAGGDADRPALLLRAEPAEHPDPHRGRPQDPARLHRGARPQARLRRLFADRAAAAWPRSAMSSR